LPYFAARVAVSPTWFDPVMQALKLAWLGTRTPHHDATVAFFRDVLGMRTELEVAGFLVADLVAAEAELRAAGIEIVRPLRGDASAGWVHFRGPDGQLYELTRDPGQL
jgi:hypothetical protein